MSFYTVIAFVIIFVMAGSLFFSIPVSLLTSRADNPGLAILLFIVVILGGVGVFFFFLYAYRAKWTQWYRLSRFSRANGLVFSVDGTVPSYPGMIFGVGAERKVPSRIFHPADPFLDVGNLRYTTGSGKNKQEHKWTYIALKLNRMVPNMILDAKSNNFLWTNLPQTFSRDQVLSLEGDFDKHFTLYCPKEYERDALYVFTPDLMTTLIDHAAGYDVELIDDWMFLYSSVPLSIGNAAALRQVFDVVNAVGTKTLSQTERYADANMGNESVPLAHGAPLQSRMSVNAVASQGRRLQKGFPLAAIIVPAVVVVIVVFNMGARFFGALFGG